MSDVIDYGNLMHSAMRGLIKKVLTDVQQHGLPGDHHFFITFDTTYPNVALADWLLDRYPQEMTVVMQHWYDNLNITDEGFGITLNFGDAPEPLFVPFDAIRTFVDPSVEFGLRFENQDQEDASSEPTLTPVTTDSPEASVTEDPVSPVSDETEGAPSEDASPKDAEIVSLDSFRK